MAKVTLNIDDKNLSIVLNILQNLKSGLIKNIELNKTKNVKSPSSSSTNNYKQKLEEKVLEDDFLPKHKSSSKYLSANEFKKKLKKR